MWLMIAAVALYDYTPVQHDELALTEGDIVHVIRKNEDDWWVGVVGDRQGIFPGTYVEEQ